MVKDDKTKLINNIKLKDVVDSKQWHPVGTKGKHTRMFPLQMPLDIINMKPESNLILDVFMGGGTVALAAEMHNKKWIGIEKDKTFCDCIIDRLNKKAG